MSGINGIHGGMGQVTAGASRQMSMNQRMGELFNKMDSAGTGSISKSQFDAAFSSLHLPTRLKTMGAAAVFSHLDPQGTGKVSQQDFVKGMKSILAKPAGQPEKPAVDPRRTLASGQESLHGAVKGDGDQDQESAEAPGSDLSRYV